VKTITEEDLKKMLENGEL